MSLLLLLFNIAAHKQTFADILCKLSGTCTLQQVVGSRKISCISQLVESGSTARKRRGKRTRRPGRLCKQVPHLKKRATKQKNSPTKQYLKIQVISSLFKMLFFKSPRRLGRSHGQKRTSHQAPFAQCEESYAANASACE